MALTSLVLCLAMGCVDKEEGKIKVHDKDHIVLIGNNLPSRMMNFGYFETELQLRYPDSTLFIRNMGDPGNTPGFRPHASRNSPWAFPGAEKFQTEYANDSGSIGHFPTEDEWLSDLDADIVIAFFGYSESFQGEKGLENFKDELHAFIKHTKEQKYNGETAPQLVLVSPIAFEDLSDKMDLPDGVAENKNLKMYTEAMAEVAAKDNVPFVNVFEPTKDWTDSEDEDITADGFQLNDYGYQKFANLLADKIFGADEAVAEAHRKAVHEAVLDKNWYWHNDFKIPNGVHAYGRRYDPFGPDNYPYEIEKIGQMTANRDTVIWNATAGKSTDLPLWMPRRKNCLPSRRIIKRSMGPVIQNTCTGKRLSIKSTWPMDTRSNCLLRKSSSPIWPTRSNFPSTTKAGYGWAACRVIPRTNRATADRTTSCSF